MTSSLPTTRSFLTSLINTLTTTPPPTQPAKNNESQSHDRSSNHENPLKTISPQQKALLATLHVLFPPPMLLQALDLLDRGLVVRVFEREYAREESEGERDVSDWEGGVHAAAGELGEIVGERGKYVAVRVGDGGQQGVREDEMRSPQAHIHISAPQSGSSSPLSSPSPSRIAVSSGTQSRYPPNGPHQLAQRKRKQNQIYQVRSSQAPKSRFSTSSSSGSGLGAIGGGGSGSIYTVRSSAWNCSCAAFAFSCFPASSSIFSSSHQPWSQVTSPSSLSSSHQVNSHEDNDLKNTAAARTGAGKGNKSGIVMEGEESEWEFGGLSRNGKDESIGTEESVPVCKHLLACVLAERWGDVLGRYVTEREVSRDEMAGLSSEG